MRAALRSVVGSRFGLRVVGIFVLAALVPLGLASALLLSEFGGLLAQRDQKDIDGLVRGYGMGLIGRLASANNVLQGLTAGADAAAAERRIAALDEMEWVRDVRHRAAGETTRSTSGRTSVLTHRDADGVARVSLLRGLADGSVIEVELAPGWLWGDLVEFTDEATIEVLDPAGARLSIEGADAARAGEGGLRQAIAAASSGTRAAGRDPDSPWAVASWELFLTGQFDSGSWRVVGFKPASSVIGGLYNTRLAFPAIVVLALLLVTLASVRLIRRQLRPLEVLVEGTKKVGRLEFSEPVKVAGDDEFADLAASFNGMTDRLRLQFSALEALAEIDRQLLQSHGLEPILGTVLPRIARVLGCQSLSVLLSDPDAADHGRAYDSLATGDTRVPIRRVVAGVDALRDVAGGSASVDISVADPRFEPFLAPMLEAGGRRFLLSALRHDGEVRGFLCAGFTGDPAESASSSVAIEDFADRLSVVLANLGRAEKLYEQANYDPLTRLANRQHFREELSRRLQRRPGASATGALLYIDLDQFKQINDTAGHTTGDQLLCAVATRLRGCFRPDDLVARLGGDEFAAIIEQTGDGDSARVAAQRVLEALHAPLQLGKREYRIEASIGITLFPADGDTIEELLKNSDMAMYRAKESGRGRAVFFETEMQDRMQARAAMESGMYRALERQEFRLVYQPIISGEAGVQSGVEALIRWPSAPGGEPISPAVFMPLAEESSLITGVGEWVLRTACEEFARWKHAGAAVGYVSVNMSSRQLRDPKFVKLVSDCLSASQMSPGELHLEITEGVLADGPSVARTLHGLSALGVHLALDDFGTGYSSLSYLRQFPIDSVKIDKSFITEIPESNSACRLVESIIAMTTVLGKHVVAEGVEEELQLAFLRSAGCGSVQGFLFSRPMEPAGIPAFFRRLAAGRIPLAGDAARPRIAAL